MTRATHNATDTHFHAVHAAVDVLLHHLQALDIDQLDPALALRLHPLLTACTAAAQLFDTAPAVPVLDRAVFDRLLVLAGPQTSCDLLDRLAEDLITVQEHFYRASLTSDWHELRMQSHILIGLAGAVGAEALRARAQDLNDLAHDPQPHLLAAWLQRIDQPLSALIRFVQAHRTERAATP